MIDNREFKTAQKKYFEAQLSSRDKGFEKFVVEYLEWKIENLYKAYKSITPTTDASEAKALATRLSGAIDAIEEMLKRMKS